MTTLIRAYTYAAERQGELIGALGQHLLLVATALVIGIVVCVPLGIVTARCFQRPAAHKHCQASEEPLRGRS